MPGVGNAAGHLAVGVDDPAFGGGRLHHDRFVVQRRVGGEHRPGLDDPRIGDQPLDPARFVELEELGDDLVDEQRLVDDRDQHRQDERLPEDRHHSPEPHTTGARGRRRGRRDGGAARRDAAGGEAQPVGDRLPPPREKIVAQVRQPPQPGDAQRPGPERGRAAAPGGSAPPRRRAWSGARVSSTATIVRASSSGERGLDVGGHLGARDQANPIEDVEAGDEARDLETDAAAGVEVDRQAPPAAAPPAARTAPIRRRSAGTARSRSSSRRRSPG